MKIKNVLFTSLVTIVLVILNGCTNNSNITTENVQNNTTTSNKSEKYQL